MDVRRRVGPLEFEWDSNKAATNYAKHGLDFDQALGVFFDESALTGDASVDDEDRSFVLGRAGRLYQPVVVVVHTERTARIRIISARPATRHEERIYQNQPGTRR